MKLVEKYLKSIYLSRKTWLRIVVLIIGGKARHGHRANDNHHDEKEDPLHIQNLHLYKLTTKKKREKNCFRSYSFSIIEKKILWTNNTSYVYKIKLHLVFFSEKESPQLFRRNTTKKIKNYSLKYKHYNDKWSYVRI